MLKYIGVPLLALCFVQMVFGLSPRGAAGRSLYVAGFGGGDTLRGREARREGVPEVAPLPAVLPDSSARASLPADSLSAGDVPARDSLLSDTAELPLAKSFLEDVISGTNTDSMVYDVEANIIYLYNEGDVTYQDMNMKADFMRIDMETKEIFANGKRDTVDGVPTVTRPEFTQKEQAFQMDTITYNIETEKAKIKGITTQEGEGYLTGQSVKRMPDNTINIARGRYTTCDIVEHPHFYLQLSKAKVIPGKKVVTGPAYMVLEDVPLPIFVPEGFFPMNTGPRSGFIMPSYGEESIKGFFIRDGGYYFAINDYIDLRVLGGIYTLGSWETSLESNYMKRYKYRGSFSARYSKDIIGEKGAADYVNMSNFKVTWTHSQDAKARPNSTFAASVNFSTSGYAKYGSTTLNDYLNTQTNSSISYSKKWAGTPFSFSTNFQHSQNSRDTTIAITFPNAVFNMSKIFPFRRKSGSGKQRWYEKISLSYSGALTNTLKANEKELFKSSSLKNMRSGVTHSIPVNASFTVLNYINLTPSFNYNERWYFKKVMRSWDPEAGAVVPTDTTYGFYRVFDYNFSVSTDTKIYARFDMKNQNGWLKAVRFTLAPNFGFSYTPDFSHPKYGYYRAVQSDRTGRIGYYSPYADAVYGVPGAGRSAALTFSLASTLEAKVRSDRDTSGVRKLKLIENLSVSGSYNFLADSLNLSLLAVNFRTTIRGNFGFNISATVDPYEVDKTTGARINKLYLRKGKLGRIASTSWAFGYTFNSRNNRSQAAVNDINSYAPDLPEYTNPFYDPNHEMDPLTRRQLMTASYYDFSLPWNLGFNYSMSYTNNGIRKRVSQTLGFNGSFSPTPKWGVTFSGGYDFSAKKITPGVVTFSRDLHCWQMNLSWVPVGYRKSWSFSISAKSSLLQDLKYDKSNSHYDSLYDY